MNIETNTTLQAAVADRITRLGLADIGESRLQSLTIAHEAGVTDDTFAKLGNALRLSRLATIVLPAHRYESLSRGRGWARKGRGDNAQWGEREDNGYRVSDGRWTVGASDGFSRKDEALWTVTHVTVGDSTWTIAL